MKAIIWTNYGPPEVLEVQDIPRPSPGPKEVLIRVHASTVTAGDCEARSFQFPVLFRAPMRLYFGLFKPRIKVLGQELAGEVVEVGNEVTEFRHGDRVVSPTMMRFGAYAEYACLPASYPIVKIPDTLSFEEAATIPTGGMNGLHFVNKAEVKAGDHVLINGAGGSIGTYALQIAKARGATVTCVDSGMKLEMLRELGADIGIDYTKEDFTQNGRRYDVIIDIVGKADFSDCIRSLNESGRLVLGNPTFSGMMRGIKISKTTSKKVLFQLAAYNKSVMNDLVKQVSNGEIKVIIDKKYRLDDMVEAHRYVEKGLKQGNVVIV